MAVNDGISSCGSRCRRRREMRLHPSEWRCERARLGEMGSVGKINRHIKWLARQESATTHIHTRLLRKLTTHEKQAPPPRSRMLLHDCRSSSNLPDKPASLGRTGDREDTDVASNANNKVLISAASVCHRPHAKHSSSASSDFLFCALSHGARRGRKRSRRSGWDCNVFPLIFS